MLNFPQLPTTHSPFKVFACACIIILLIELSPSPADSFLHSCFSSHLSAILHSFFLWGGGFFSLFRLLLSPTASTSPPLQLCAVTQTASSTLLLVNSPHGCTFVRTD